MSSKGMAVALLVGMLAIGAAVVMAHEKVAILDDCDPTDLNWAPIGGCALVEGDVNVAEFNALLSSPLAKAVIGHPAWRFDPAYLKIEPDKTVRVTNKGGRGHTFTEVAEFGGGRVPNQDNRGQLNFGLTRAPECPLQPPADPNNLPPGASVKVKLGVGNHRFQCCIHPWMRMLIKVLPDEPEEED